MFFIPFDKLLISLFLLILYNHLHSLFGSKYESMFEFNVLQVLKNIVSDINCTINNHLNGVVSFRSAFLHYPFRLLNIILALIRNILGRFLFWRSFWWLFRYWFSFRLLYIGLAIFFYFLSAHLKLFCYLQ